MTVKYFKPIMGALLIITAILLLVYWESYGREKITTTGVLAAGMNIQKGTALTADMLKVSRVLNENVTEDSLLPGDAAQVVGKVLNRSIKANSPILSGAVVEKDMYDDKLTIFSIKNEWIYSLSESLRSGDEVQCFTEDGRELLGTYKVAFVRDESGLEVVTAETHAGDVNQDNIWERGDATGQIYTVEIMTSAKEYTKLFEAAAEQGRQLLIVQKR